MVRFAREQGIRCQGRGAAANSLVAYLLFISPISPLMHDLVFERSLSDERRGTPGIDSDFQADRREEVIQYVYQRYGTDHAAMACTFVTFRERSAIREVGRALGLPPDLIDNLADATLDQAPPTAQRPLKRIACEGGVVDNTFDNANELQLLSAGVPSSPVAALSSIMR